MHSPVREGLLRPVPEEPWWWPLGPTGFILGMLAGVIWYSTTWPIPPEVLTQLRASLKALLGLLTAGWVALAVALRVRRHKRVSDPLWVQVDAAGLTLDSRQLPWSSVGRCEWSPFGLLIEVDGTREQIPARITDAQASRLNEATADMRPS